MDKINNAHYVQVQILLNILDEVTKRYDEIFELKEKMLEEANFKSTHDPLTLLYNRSFFEKKLEELVLKEVPFALVFLDLDNFKQVNDTYGHDAGDEVLIDMAKILRTNLKGKDVIARLGGDEFVVILPEVTKEEAQKIFTKIEDKVKKIFKEYNISASVGIAEFPEIKDPKELLKMADKNMYKAKQAGKGRVVV
jgi:diguanylate cyclase (GGDEF)-like protein